MDGSEEGMLARHSYLIKFGYDMRDSQRSVVPGINTVKCRF